MFWVKLWPDTLHLTYLNLEGDALLEIQAFAGCGGLTRGMHHSLDARAVRRLASQRCALVEGCSERCVEEERLVSSKFHPVKFCSPLVILSWGQLTALLWSRPLTQGHKIPGIKEKNPSFLLHLHIPAPNPHLKPQTNLKEITWILKKFSVSPLCSSLNRHWSSEIKSWNTLDVKLLMKIESWFLYTSPLCLGTGCTHGSLASPRAHRSGFPKYVCQTQAYSNKYFLVHTPLRDVAWPAGYFQEDTNAFWHTGFHHKVKPVTGQQKRVCRTLLWAGKRRHARGITEAHAAGIEATVKGVPKEGQWRSFQFLKPKAEDDHSIRATQLCCFYIQGSKHWKLRLQRKDCWSQEGTAAGCLAGATRGILIPILAPKLNGTSEELWCTHLPVVSTCHVLSPCHTESR